MPGDVGGWESSAQEAGKRSVGVLGYNRTVPVGVELIDEHPIEPCQFGAAAAASLASSSRLFVSSRFVRNSCVSRYSPWFTSISSPEMSSSSRISAPLPAMRNRQENGVAVFVRDLDLPGDLWESREIRVRKHWLEPADSIFAQGFGERSFENLFDWPLEPKDGVRAGLTHDQSIVQYEKNAVRLNAPWRIDWLLIAQACIELERLFFLTRRQFTPALRSAKPRAT